MKNLTHSNASALLDQISQIAGREPLLALLDLLEPVSALSAQLLYVAQPAARLLGDRGSQISILAQLLETPEGIAQMRSYLETPPHSDGDMDA